MLKFDATSHTLAIMSLRQQFSGIYNLFGTDGSGLLAGYFSSIPTWASEQAEMAVQQKKYRQFQAAAQRALESMGSQASTPGVVGRLGMDVGVQLKARTDPSNRHLAQMLAQGCCLGVTGCVMARRDNPAASENAQRLARELEQFEQNAADRWREFL